MRLRSFWVLGLGAIGTLLAAACGDSGSTGDGPECTVDADCPGTPCATAVCNQNACSTVSVAQGTVLGTQAVGDCSRVVCDGQGSSTSLEDATDVPSGMGPCNVGSCTGSTPTQTPKAEGTTCATDGGTVCDGQGACVECVVDGDCTSNLCVDGTCAPVTCTNLVKDGEETDVDCGGTQCLPCADTKACLVDADCESDVCTGDVCQAPTCSDTTSNGDETGVDCGGPDCPTCMNGQACAVDADCTNDSCVNLVCADPTCTDLVQNGTETDVDCGGSCTTKCMTGDACALDTDCVGQMCVADVCTQINGCDAANTEDHTSQANVTITQSGLTYTPKCIRVNVGTIVKIDADFTFHPLLGGEVVNGAKVPAGSGPFVPITNSGTTKNFTMNTAGTFPYYCDQHALGGMTGAVFVE